VSAPKTLTVTNLAGQVTATYPDFDPGQPVRVAPDRHGSNVTAAEDGWTFRGPSRHPQYAIVEHTAHRATVEVERARLSLRA
jgi:hypothetical protein